MTKHELYNPNKLSEKKYMIWENNKRQTLLPLVSFLLSFIFYSLVPGIGYGQGHPNVNTSGSFSGLTFTIKEIPLEEGSKIRNHYYSTDWRPVFLHGVNGDSARIERAKYDMLNDRIEIDQEGKLYYLELSNLASFSVADIFHFASGESLGIEEKTLQREFFQVLENGKYHLLKRFEVIRKPPDYNLATNTGSRDERIAINEIYIVVTPEGNIAEAKGNIRKWEEIFGKAAADARSYVKDNKLNTRQEEDLSRLINYINNEQS
jgi:hypothetical protein